MVSGNPAPITLPSRLGRTVGEFPGVVVVNSTAGGHASLLADVHCGNGTKLILYMNPGEVLYRTITSKDTHGTNGKLLVPYAEPERVDEGNQKRVRATTAVLGFGSPSFSYGTDLLLPAEMNTQLRGLLLAGHKPEMTRGDEDDDDEIDDGDLATRIITGFRGVSVPEVDLRGQEDVFPRLLNPRSSPASLYKVSCSLYPFPVMWFQFFFPLPVSFRSNPADTLLKEVFLRVFGVND